MTKWRERRLSVMFYLIIKVKGYNLLWYLYTLMYYAFFEAPWFFTKSGISALMLFYGPST